MTLGSCLVGLLGGQSFLDIFLKSTVNKSPFRANWLSYTKDSLILIDLRNMNSSNAVTNMPTMASTTHQPPFIESTHTLLGISHLFSHLASQEIERKATEVHFKWGKGLLPRLLSGSKAFPITHSFGEKGRTDLSSQTSVQTLGHSVILLAYHLYRGID